MNNAYSPQGGQVDYSSEFDYTVWTPGTIVKLANVPWDSSYRDVVDFASENDLLSYLDNNSGPTITIERMTYAAYTHPVHIPLTFNRANKFNYLVVENPLHPVSDDEPRRYYYFITDVTFVAPNTTRINVQLDVWTTYRRNVTFGNAFVERGHVGIANENNFSNWGRDHLTTPEGFDLGNEYVIRDSDAVTFLAATHNDATPDYRIVIYSTTNIHVPWGTTDKPVLSTAMGSIAEGLPNGMAMYIVPDVRHFIGLMTHLSRAPWVAQGITSVQAMPLDVMNLATSYYKIGPNSTPTQVDQGTFNTIENEPKFAYAEYHNHNQSINGGGGVTYTNFRDKFYAQDRYSHLKKFLTFPYSYLEVTMYNGSQLIVKPELVADNHFVVEKYSHYTQPSPRVMFALRKYNTNPNKASQESVNKGLGEHLNYCIGVTNFPSFSITNNGYLTFMASNAHGIAFQHTSADWSQQRAMMGANAARQNAQSSINNMEMQAGIAIGSANQNLGIQNDYLATTRLTSGIANVVGAGVGGMLTGGPLGAGASLIGASIGAGASYLNTTHEIDKNAAMNAVAVNAMSASNVGNVAQARNVADTNLNLAREASAGDYANTIAGINARVQDAKLTPPTVSGQVGGDAFNLVVDGMKLYIKHRSIPDGVRRVIGDYWLRYGYAVNRFINMPANVSVMNRFSYWRVKELTVRASSCPETFKQTIRGIFEKGVTVWKNPSDIGTVDIADNAPVGGISYE